MGSPYGVTVAMRNVLCESPTSVELAFWPRLCFPGPCVLHGSADAGLQIEEAERTEREGTMLFWLPPTAERTKGPQAKAPGRPVAARSKPVPRPVLRHATHAHTWAGSPVSSRLV
jgi:hypothetical protein